MVNYRERMKRSARTIVGHLGPFLGDEAIATLYEAIDWADTLGPVVGEAVDQVAVSVANGLYNAVGRIYKALGWMSEEELALRKQYVEAGGLMERGELGSLDVIPAYHGSLGMYHVLRTIRDIRNELYTVLEPVYRRRYATT